MIDAVIVVSQRRGLRAEAVVADRIDEVVAAKGTKYLRVSLVSQLKEAIRKGKRRLAIVGTPCQVRAVRKIQKQGSLNDEHIDAEITLIGLFCFESFNHRDLRERIIEIMGVDQDDASRVQISKGNYIVTIGEEEHSCKVKELHSAVREGCQFCNDFVSRFADLSVGSVGSPDGYSTVIVRSDMGKRLIEAADFTRAEANKDEIVKLSKLKRKNAERSFAKITDGL